MRDLEKDLDICNAATPGPWKRNEKPSFGDWWVYVGGQHICLLPADKKGTHFGEMFKANAEFIAAAREGWPHAIERAIKAEAKFTECRKAAEVLQAEVERLRLMVTSITGGLDEAIEAVHFLETENAKLQLALKKACDMLPACPERMNQMNEPACRSCGNLGIGKNAKSIRCLALYPFRYIENYLEARKIAPAWCPRRVK